MKTKTRFMTNRTITHFTLTALIMIMLGILFFRNLNAIVTQIAVSKFEREVKNAADYYAENLQGNMKTLEHIAIFLQDDTPENQERNLEEVRVLVDRLFGDDPNVIFGVMTADGLGSLYGDRLPPREYKGLLSTLCGNSGISYMNSGGLLYSYSVRHGDNVRYILYALCSSHYLEDNYPLTVFGDLGDVMLLNKNGDIVIPAENLSKEKEEFYQTRSVKAMFDELLSMHGRNEAVVSRKKTKLGDMFFFSAEVKNTELAISGAIEYDKALGGVTAIVNTSVIAYTGFCILILMMGLVLSRTSAKASESDELRKAKALAEEASKAKSMFMASMSHEIRTPINAVLGLDELILREFNDPVLRQYATSIRASARGLLELVNNILDFSRMEAGKISLNVAPYKLSDMIYDVASMISSRAEAKGLKLEVIVDENTPENLIGDVIRIKQIVLNLMTNAVKYTEKGNVFLNIGYEEAENDSINLKVSVKDTGIGMKPEDVERLFTAFERFDEAKNRTIEGTGLGMNIVKNLLDLMESHIEVESVYGEGSEFSFSVLQKLENREPIGKYEFALQKSAENEDREEYRPSFYAPDKKVLVVDDTEINLQVIAGLLSKTGLKLELVESGQQALEVMKDTKFDVCLIDHRMPKMDGIELLQHIRNDENNPNRDGVCIVLTANVVEGGREMYLSAGFDDYLEKPVEGRTLEKMLIKYMPGIEGSAPDDGIRPEGYVKKSGKVPTDNDVNKKLEELEKDGYINIQAGIEFAGNMELFVTTLRFFRDVIDTKADELDELYMQENLKDYGVKAHALKSSAKLIGATKLAEMALGLELAGKKEDLEYIREHNMELLAEYRAYKDRFKDI